MWQVWDGQLSPSFKYKVLKLLEGGNATGVRQSSMLGFYRGKGVQKNKPTMFTVGSSTSATFVLPVRHGTCVAVQTKKMETDMLCGVMT